MSTVSNHLESCLLADPIRQKLNEPAVPTIQDRVLRAVWGHWDTRQMPTATQRRAIEIAEGEFAEVREELTNLIEQQLAQVEAELEAAGAPWTPR